MELDLVTAVFTGIVLVAFFAMWKAATAITSGRFMKSIQSRIEDTVKTAVDHALEVQLKDHQAKLDKELEDHKVKLQLQHTKELEAIRADVRVDAFRREDRLRHLHLKQAEVLDETFKATTRMLAALHATSHPSPDYVPLSPSQIKAEFDDAWSGFLLTTGTNRIYLPQTLYLQLGSLKKAADELKQGMCEGGPTEESLANFMGLMASLGSDIDNEFRRVIGTLEVPPSEELQQHPEPS